MMQTAYIR